MKKKTGKRVAAAQEETAEPLKTRKQRKRAREAEAEAQAQDDDDDEGDEGEEEEAQVEDNMDVEFEFCEPDEKDYHSVSELLKSGTWDFLDLNFAELTESVVGQGNIGTLIKSDKDGEEEIVSGMMTTLNLRQFAHFSWPKAIGNALLEKAKKHADEGAKKQLEELLNNRKEGKEVGLILSERFLNLPFDLVPPLHRAMQEDIEWSCTTPECSPEERPFYGFTHFVCVGRCFGADSGASSSSPAAASGGKKRKKKNKVQSNGEDGGGGDPDAEGASLVFAQVEDELYMKRASFSFTFPAPGKGEKKVRGPGAKLPERRAVSVITRKAFEQIVADLPEFMSAKSEPA